MIHSTFFRVSWLVVAVSLCVVANVPAERGAADSSDTTLLAKAKHILAASSSTEVGEMIDQLGEDIACQQNDAMLLLESLATNPSIEADTLRAELLIWLARGDETPMWKRKNRTQQPKVMATDELGRRAAVLLDHADPFVRGLAEWAIAIRLGVECEGLRVKPWPSADDCDWYRRWVAIGPEQWLELDFVRQASAVGWHRSTGGLLDSAERLTAQANGLAAHIRDLVTVRERETLELRLATLTEMRTALAEYAKTNPVDLTGQRRRWLAMRRAARDVALCNPHLRSREIVFATRTGPDNGNITNGGVRDVFGPHGEVYIKRGLSPDDPAQPLINARLGPGHIRGLDLWWDADRVLFSYLKQPQYDTTKNAISENSEGGRSQTAHLYEMSIDGSQLRQLTDATYNSDVEPCYLPDGDFVFVSDRSNYGSQCAGSLHQDKMILNLFRSSHDGSKIWPLSNNKDFDRYPHMMDNGQILLLHWEYQERHLWQTHTLWTCRPDGSMPDAIYKQHIESGPMSLREARQIPGQSKLVAIACGHHNGEVGAVFLVDYTRGINNPAGMRTVTPHVSGTEGGYGKAKPVDEGGVLDGGGHYQFPYPLSDNSFLVSYSYKRPEAERARGFGLYYIDVWGNKELIHRDRHLSVAYLMPLESRARPPLLRDVNDAGPSPRVVSDERSATVYMADVEHGLSDVEPGTVKYVRISQHVPWPCVREEDKACGYNDLHATPSGAWTRVFGAWTWAPARVIGVVPVEEDGSAHFKVPADQPVYFHALDKDFLEVRRMRSNVTFQQGENRGCIGCHESRSVTPPALNDWSGLSHASRTIHAETAKLGKSPASEL